MDRLGLLYLLEPTPIHPRCWHKNKRLFQDNFSEAKIIHVTQVEAFRQRLRNNDQYQQI